MKYLVAFGRFWYDFIVGDSMALAIGGAGALALAAALVHSQASALAEFALPAIVVGTLVISLRPAK